MDFIRESLNNAKETLENFLNDDEQIAKIKDAIMIFVDVYAHQGKILSCGNGGSLCDSMHFAEELTGRFRKNRRALAAISINDSAHISCVANDFDFEDIFSRYIDALGTKDDALLAITTSGNSVNVINAVKEARKKGIKTIGLLGKDGGQLKNIVDIPIIVNSTLTERIQEIHIKIIHLFIEGIERSLFPENYS